MGFILPIKEVIRCLLAFYSASNRNLVYSRLSILMESCIIKESIIERLSVKL